MGRLQGGGWLSRGFSGVIHGVGMETIRFPDRFALNLINKSKRQIRNGFYIFASQNVFNRSDHKICT